MSSDVDHVAYVFVGGNGESVQALGPPEAVGAIREVIAERDRLVRWKDKAIQVLEEGATLTATLIAEGDRMCDAVRDVMQGLPPGDLRTALTEACWWWERRATDDRHR